MSDSIQGQMRPDREVADVGLGSQGTLRNGRQCFSCAGLPCVLSMTRDGQSRRQSLPTVFEAELTMWARSDLPAEAARLDIVIPMGRLVTWEQGRA